jgi:CzcA family heavy metal efflux pump
MIKKIIITSMKLRLLVATVAVLLIMFGITQLTNMPVDALPEFSRPYVEIQTEALGLSAAEIEAFITTPLEADMLNGTSWVEEIRSESIPGLSSIVLIFKTGTDIMDARQMVQERLIEIFALPGVSKPPTMLNPLSSTSRVMKIGLSSEKLSLIDISVLARWTIVPRLMGVPGVANVSIWGQRKRQLQVLVDPEKIEKKGVKLDQIISTTGNALWVSPLSYLDASTPGTGGFFDTPNQRLGVRHILPISTPEQLAEVVVEGTEYSLNEISNVIEDHQPLIGDALVDESPNIMLIVEKFPWANTIDVTEDVEAALTNLRPGLAGLQMNSTLFRPATFLEVATSNLTAAFFIGGILLILALFAFSLNWRSALISIMSILISFIIAVTVLYLQGITLNLMILAGLIVAIGLIIDESIIDVERIKRRIRQNKEQGSDKNIAAVIYEASLEMRNPMIYAGTILILSIMPILFLEGIAGSFYGPVASAFILALVASFVTATVLTPALCLLLFKNSYEKSDSPISKALKSIYDSLFTWVTRVPRTAFITVCVIIVLGIIGVLFIQQDSVIPTLKETDLLVRWDGPTGTSHPEMSRIASLVSDELRDIPGVRNVSANIGRAVLSDRVTNVNSGQIWVSINPLADYEATVTAVEEVVEGYPGLSNEVLTYLQSKVREEISGTDESIIVRIYGEDLGVIRNKAEEVKELLAHVDGIDESSVLYPEEEPTVEIEVDLEAAKRYGLKPGDVRRQSTSLVSGIVVGNLFEEQKVFDVVVWGVPEIRHSITSLEELLINTPNRGTIPLKEVADIRIVPGPTNIKRESVIRYVDVIATVDGGDYIGISADINSVISQVDFPLEYRAELLGEFAEKLAAHDRIQSLVIAAALLIFLLLQVLIRSWKFALALFLTLPVSLVGGVIMVILGSGSVLSLGSILGFIAVFSIAIRNNVLLIHQYRATENVGEKSFGPELALSVTREESVSVLKTAIITFLTFLPLAFFGNIAGLEILYPAALVILGGLVTSTLYTLMGVPALYLMFGSSPEPELDFLLDAKTAEGREL